MMAIILLPKSSKKAAISISSRTAVFSLAALAIVLPAIALVMGFNFGAGSISAKQSLVTSGLKAELDVQREDILKAKQDAQENLHAMTKRLAELQSRVVRLDALGERLTEMAKLDKGEFDFDNLPAIGGPAAVENVVREAGLDDFLGSFDHLSRQLEDREQQLSVLESLLMSRNLQEEVHPAGFPAEKGWLSSHFGIRTDPFSGRPAHHDGVDIAGKLGSNILAVAAGVVTWSGDRYGYGNLVEINHGNGYVTRYAHNKENMVEVGDTVKKAQVIALMGSSGRSTGPHVHFEVLHNGRVVNPVKYVRAARK